MLGVPERFRNRLREIRKQKGISVDKLSAICGVDSQYIIDIEEGIHIPNLEMMDCLANALEVPPRKLI